MQKVRRAKINVPGEYKIMAMRKGGIDRVWLRQMAEACYDYNRKRSENLRKVSNRESSSDE